MVISNMHVHSPYSFSSFDNIRELVSYAKEEHISALGINDFNTFDGFTEFADLCEDAGIYPIFNVEFITLSADDKKRGVHWNDPVNPGIMYLCGKGLNRVPKLSQNTCNIMASVWKGSQDRIWKMIDILNMYMHSKGIDIILDYCQIRSRYAKSSVRERHLAKAIYMSFVEKWSDPAKLLEMFRRLFDNREWNGELYDTVNMQNEIRMQLLKAGQVAYVEEKQDAFIGFEEAKQIILEAGGIPCYPMLVDNMGCQTEMESNVSVLESKLREMGICAVEFISNRTPFDLLKKYSRYFVDKGFCVTFGTEHNTPEHFSLVPCAQKKFPFDNELRTFAHNGTCIFAAHQERVNQNFVGFVDKFGSKAVSNLDEFVKVGEKAIKLKTCCIGVYES